MLWFLCDGGPPGLAPGGWFAAAPYCDGLWEIGCALVMSRPTRYYGRTPQFVVGCPCFLFSALAVRILSPQFPPKSAFCRSAKISNASASPVPQPLRWPVSLFRHRINSSARLRRPRIRGLGFVLLVHSSTLLAGWHWVLHLGPRGSCFQGRHFCGGRPCRAPPCLVDPYASPSSAPPWYLLCVLNDFGRQRWPLLPSLLGWYFQP